MTEEQAKFWREGYDAGYKSATRENDEAIRIGRPILDVLSEKFEFKQEDD